MLDCYHWICMIYEPGMMSYLEEADVKRHGCQIAEQFDAVCKGFVEF